MYISCNLINSFLDTTEKINWEKAWDMFTITTAEVENIIYKGNQLNKVVVGRVVEVESSQAEYRTARVDIGSQILQTVTNYQNIAGNMLVAVALAGGSLTTISRVSETIINDMVSQCWICSEKDLGIGEENFKALELTGDYKQGQDLKEVVPLEDIIVEIDNKSLTNRPDLWGHYGIARELAAILGVKLIPLNDTAGFKVIDSLEPLNVTIEDRENCNRYCCVKISNISQQVTPIQLRILLFYCGMRPKSLIVDLTNFIMMELGQPLHAYDSSSISQITVQNSLDGCYKLKTLDNVWREIPANTILISSNTEILGLAGVIGSQSAEVTAATTDVIIESANFNSTTVRLTATKLGLRTDASSRFEKSLDPNMTMPALKRFIELLMSIDSGAQISSAIVDKYVNKTLTLKIVLPKGLLAKYIGTQLKDNIVKGILTPLGFTVLNNDDSYLVEVPTFRATKDISTAIDLVEEIARSYGYDNLVPDPLVNKLVLPPEASPRSELAYDLKLLLATKFNMSEVHTYLWYDTRFLNHLGLAKSDSLKIINTSKNENNFLRSELALSLLHCIKKNAIKRKTMGIFEIGSVIRKDSISSEYIDSKRLGLALVDEITAAQKTYMKMKNIIYSVCKTLCNVEVQFAHSVRKAEEWEQETGILDVITTSKIIGSISITNNWIADRVSSDAVCIIAELDMSALEKICSGQIRYQEPTRFPTVDLDFNFVVEQTTEYCQVKSYIDAYDNELIQTYQLHDVYQGASVGQNKKSLTFRFTIGARDRTLVNSEITGFCQGLIDYMAGKDINIRE